MKVLIIGGVAGGASAAARLRRLDEQAEIILIEKGEYISFANCGLPYYIGNTIKEKSALTIQTPKSFNARFNIDVRVLNEVIKIDKDKKILTIKDISKDTTYEEAYDKLIISTGAFPIKPNIDGIDNYRVFSLKNIPDTYKIKDFITEYKPKSALIAGAGYIGLEMAENLSKLGINVTIVDLSDHIIPPIDFDTSCEVCKYLKDKKINIILKQKVSKVNLIRAKELVYAGSESISDALAVNNHDDYLEVSLSDKKVNADMLIMSIGVAPDTKIALEAGLDINKKGSIIVDEFMRTSDKDIYAVGDAIEVTNFITKKKDFIPLAGPANKQGRIAADNICGINSKYNGTQGSSILKLFDMTVACTGINEKTAKQNNIDYDKIFLYSASHATYYPNSQNMLIKVIYKKEDGLILGAQIVGSEGVDKRCDVLATAIRAKMTCYDLTQLELCYAPPYSSAKDPVNMAGYVIENILTNKVKQFHFDDIDKILNDDNVTLLDVRTKKEYKKGFIKGFINIPLDELRKNLDKLDKSKPIYVHCHSGLRSYIACRILTQNGMDAYNLSGGYRLYETIKEFL